LNSSYSEIHQDLFVLFELEFKRNGYFVEFGALNGVSFSNTIFLEKKIGWTGILCEPARNLHLDLMNNRDCLIDFRCVYKKSGDEVAFLESKYDGLSTIVDFADNSNDHYPGQIGLSYNVPTVSLNDLLIYHNAPYYIDYMSIDTEGSEYDILENFHFSKHFIKIITCEHNYTASRKKWLY